MAESPAFALGLDFGTASVRALIVDAADGREVATSVAPYERGAGGVITSRSDPNLARQHPGDYLSGMQSAVAAALTDAARDPAFDVACLVGIGVDATGSTPIPVDARNVPLAMHSEFAADLDAHAWLWKDHTSHAEAAEITQRARERSEPYLSKCGGTYSSEWYWSKILRCERTNPRSAAAAHAWIEQSDFVPAWLVGIDAPEHAPRSLCAAGHKGMYHVDWGGLPSAAFLDALQPGLARFRARFRAPAVPSNHVAGRLCPVAAAKLGLPAGLPVAVGIIDAHAGAVGSGCAPGTLVKIIGTSTCDCIVSPLEQPLADIPGVCGIVPESIVPGMYGIEAGQSAVGDIFNWFVERIAPAAYGGDALCATGGGALGATGGVSASESAPRAAGAVSASATHAELSRAAAALQPGESGLLALDWHNGNRTILVDPLLTGLLIGQTLATTPPEIYRALIEATAFGARRIIERIEEYGVPIRRIVACGGVAEKNPLLMQIYADVCNRPMFIARSPNACALGAAVFGSVVGGAHPDVPTAQAAMTGMGSAGVSPATGNRGASPAAYHPQPAAAAVYERLYTLYCQLHDAFGSPTGRGSLHGVMKMLIALRNEIRARAATGAR